MQGRDSSVDSFIQQKRKVVAGRKFWKGGGKEGETRQMSVGSEVLSLMQCSLIFMKYVVVAQNVG